MEKKKVFRKKLTVIISYIFCSPCLLNNFCFSLFAQLLLSFCTTSAWIPSKDGRTPSNIRRAHAPGACVPWALRSSAQRRDVRTPARYAHKLLAENACRTDRNACCWTQRPEAPANPSRAYHSGSKTAKAWCALGNSACAFVTTRWWWVLWSMYVESGSVGVFVID